MGDIDFRKIGDAALAHAESLLASWYPDGFFEGHRRFKVGSVQGGAGESLVIEYAGAKAGMWVDFASGEKGSDLISLYAAKEGISQGEAAKRLGDDLRVGPPPKPTKINRRPGPSADDEDAPVPIVPVPEDAPAPKFRAPDAWGQENGRWCYRDAAGRVLMWVVRHETGDGKKDLRPYTYCQHADGTRKWRWRALPRPWPLYGLELLAANPGATVVLVEGEKKADAGRRLLTGQIVMGWPGGVEQAINGHIDLSPLAGRKVVCWPDADQQHYREGHARAGELMAREDQPGWRAAAANASRLKGIAIGIRLVVPPEGRKDGWDLADAEDEGWTQDGTLDWMRGHLLDPEAPVVTTPVTTTPVVSTEPPEHRTQTDDGVPPAESPDDYGADDRQGPPEIPDDIDDSEPPALPDHPWFTALGHNGNRYHYLIKGTKQTTEISGAGHSKLSLLQLAPLQFWEREYAGEKGVRWDAAASACMAMGQAAGVWDSGRIRGRGCWWDRGRMIVHLGDRLLVDGAQVDPTEIRSGYVYEAAPKMRGPGRRPLTAKEGRRIVETAKRFAWEMPASAALLCGWIALAPVCGALGWRPHIWITGGSGSGKTTVMESFLAPLCGGTEIRVQGSSTEAGIRQTLRADARPVVFDESESNDEREAARVQAILALIRQSSSESGAQTIKGSATGQAMAFHIRSMFCLASINVTIKQQADHTRIAVLGLRSASSTGTPEERAANWKALEAELEEILTDRELPGRLLARIVGMIPIIRANIKTFIRVAAKHFKSQRLGDQYGTLLAGCYALWQDGEATEQQAQDLIDRFAWTQYTEEAEEDESMSCLSSMLQAQVRVDGPHGGLSMTLGELVAVVAGRSGRFDQGQAVLAIGRHGLRVQDDMLLVANKSDTLARLLRDRPWGHGWGNYLKRIKGASAHKPTQFIAGHVSRGTAIPLAAVLGDA